MKEKVTAIQLATEKRLRQLQNWRRAVKVLADAYSSQEPDAALLRAHLDRLDGWPDAFPEQQAVWQALSSDVAERYSRMMRHYEGLLRAACEQAGYTLQGRFPDLTVDGLISVRMNPEKNTAQINRKRAGDLALATVMGKIAEEHKRVWERRFTPSTFLARLKTAYDAAGKARPGDPVPLQKIYDQLSGSQEGYQQDMFAADLARLLESGELVTKSGAQLTLAPVRDTRQAVYLFDRRTGRPRYVGLIQFKEVNNR